MYCILFCMYDIDLNAIDDGIDSGSTEDKTDATDKDVKKNYIVKKYIVSISPELAEGLQARGFNNVSEGVRYAIRIYLENRI